MLKSYHLKRPVYNIWRYQGEDVLPQDVAQALSGVASSVRVITTQGSFPYKFIELVVGNKTRDVLEGDYIILYSKDMGGFFSRVLEIRPSIGDFEEAS